MLKDDIVWHPMTDNFGNIKKIFLLIYCTKDSINPYSIQECYFYSVENKWYFKNYDDAVDFDNEIYIPVAWAAFPTQLQLSYIVKVVTSKQKEVKHDKPTGDVVFDTI